MDGAFTLWIDPPWSVNTRIENSWISFTSKAYLKVEATSV
jgi:hypothetical protein